MLFNQIINLFYTLKYLKISQLVWRVWFLLDKKIILKKTEISINKLILILPELSVSKSSNFQIFNQSYNGKELSNDNPLKTYHLNYFDYIIDFEPKKGIELIIEWINNNKDINHISWDPYPISLRIVNWIKFLSKNHISHDDINSSLYQQSFVLFRRREYHLLTNHLFKNIVALLFAGVLFNEKKWKNWALRELKKQLKEQLTIDNYHFELSPTYHAIFTQDLLNIYNLLMNNSDNDSRELAKEIEVLIPDILYWCDYFSNNEEYLKINDVNYEGCPTLNELNEYAKLLGINRSDIKQKNNHYPILENNNLKIMMYCAEHQPSYNPAHSHDDLTSIMLWQNKKPILIDTGNYCYDETDDRDYSRSTKAHNCFTINNENQSEMWKVFRIGRRSKILQKNISEDRLSCSHNGYKKFGVNYSRTIQTKDSGFEIIDNFESNNNNSYQIYFHFHPETNLIKKENSLIINDTIRIKYQSSNWKIIETEFYPEMFKKTKKQTIVVSGEISEKLHSTLIEEIR
ncbi:MAG: alginate lyase family protein [Candidatus Cloacimonetes bacterium]|nr:alginate lyase family protein [Candidatus Cloacimonadota bacterium]